MSVAVLVGASLALAAVLFSACGSSQFEEQPEPAAASAPEPTPSEVPAPQEQPAETDSEYFDALEQAVVHTHSLDARTEGAAMHAALVEHFAQLAEICERENREDCVAAVADSERLRADDADGIEMATASLGSLVRRLGEEEPAHARAVECLTQRLHAHNVLLDLSDILENPVDPAVGLPDPAKLRRARPHLRRARRAFDAGRAERARVHTLAAIRVLQQDDYEASLPAGIVGSVLSTMERELVSSEALLVAHREYREARDALRSAEREPDLWLTDSTRAMEVDLALVRRLVPDPGLAVEDLSSLGQGILRACDAGGTGD